jgi:hypothetical protein
MKQKKKVVSDEIVNETCLLQYKWLIQLHVSFQTLIYSLDMMYYV